MERRGFWIMAAALMLVCFLAAGGSLRGRLMAALPQPSAVIKEETVNCGTAALVTDIRLPVVSGLGGDKIELELNKKVRGQVEAARTAAEAEAAALWREAQLKGFTPWTYVFAADYEAYSVRGVLSLRVTTDLDNGGTGLPHTVYYNVDIERRCWLKLVDLFVSDEYRRVIDGYISEQISHDERFIPEAFAGVSAGTSFFISNGRLCIAFAKYEIASGMTGEPVFEIPPGLLHGLVRPEYAGVLL